MAIYLGEDADYRCQLPVLRWQTCISLCLPTESMCHFFVYLGVLARMPSFAEGYLIPRDLGSISFKSLNILHNSFLFIYSQSFNILPGENSEFGYRHQSRQNLTRHKSCVSRSEGFHY
jgi:hypothetical protein